MSKLIISLVLLVFVSGCAKFGPDRVIHDRFNYSNAIGISFKEQVLLNIVKLRYMDTPIILQVGTIVSSYSVTGTVSLTGEVEFGSTDILTSGIGGSFTESPTITYSQITGKDFVERVLKPVPPSSFMFLIEADWRADHIFVTIIDEINGYRNQSRVASNAVDERFTRISELFFILQQAGALALGDDNGVNQSGGYYLRLVNLANTPAIQNAIDEFQTILKLDPCLDTYKVIFGNVAPDAQTIAMKTRSALQIMREYGSFIDVPAEHLSGGSVERYDKSNTDMAEYTPVVIKSGRPRPNRQVFAAVNYLDTWYWIDNQDYETKRNINVLMMLLAIAGSGIDPDEPVLTINAN